MPEQASSRNRAGRTGFSWKTTAAVVWLVFSVALAVWWLIFGLQQVDRIARIAGEVPSGVAREIQRQHRMLLSEGLIFIALLLGGGVSLLYYIRHELKRTRALQEFFAAFTHDLKTSLASLRLQAESLEEDLRDSGHERLMKRLVKDTVRLELQLENSLLLAGPDDASKLLIEPLQLSSILQPMSYHWPELKLEVKGDATVRGDRRALESVFKNFLQNAVVHGRAQFVRIDITDRGGDVEIHIEDDGRGFSGDRAKLGRMFERHSTSSGSGLGLYLSRQLIELTGGRVGFVDSQKGFAIEVTLPRADAEVAS